MGSFGVPDSIVTVGHARRVWLAVILACGVLVRLPLLPLSGYPPDLAYWKSWATYSTAFGIQHVYALDVPGQAYPPVLLYLLWGLGRLYHFVWPAADDSAILTAFVKVPALVGDILCVLFVARLASRRSSTFLGPVAAASLLAFHPAMIWLSSYWGQVDVLLGVLVAAAWVAAWRGAALIAGALAALAVLTKPQALIAVPILTTVLYARRRSGGVALAGGAAWIVAVALTLPFLAAGYRTALTHVYTGAGNIYPYWSVNGFNPWWAVVVATGGADAPLTYLDDRGFLGPITPRRLGIALLLAATAWIVVRAFRVASRPEMGPRSRGWRLLTLQWLAFFLFTTQMHERYLVPALVSFAPAAVMERRWFWIYVAMSVAVLLNLLYMVPGLDVIGRAVRTFTGRGLVVAGGLTIIAGLLVAAEIREGKKGGAGALSRGQG